MRIRRFVCLLLLLTISLCKVVGQEKMSKIKILPLPTIEARNNLLAQLEIDHFFEDENGVIAEITQTAMRRLRSANARYEVLVDDVARDLYLKNKQFFSQRAKVTNQQNRVAFEESGGLINNLIPRPAAFEVKSTFGGYYSFPEMEAAMNTLVATYPSIAQKTSLGKTAENRDIWCIKISDNVQNDELNEPEILYMGLQHPREAITGASMIFFMQYLCEFYSKDIRIKNLVDNRVIYIIPCFNPDGYEYNRSTNPNGGGAWRKNRSPQGKVSGTDAYGVDLNRNWGVDWAHCSAPIKGNAGSCGSATKTAETYWGPSAFSEKETQAVKAFAESRRLAAAFDQHAFGPYYSLPYGRQSLRTMHDKGNKLYTAVSALMGTYNGMRAADSYDALGYEVAGGFKDWMFIGNIGTGTKDTVWAMTGEGGAGGGTAAFGGMSNFWAPASQIVNLSKGMCYQNIQLAYAAGTYVDIQDANSIGINNLSCNLSFRIKRLGIGNKPVTVSFIPLENIQSSNSTVTVNSMEYFEEFTGNVGYTLNASISNGQRIRYVWQVSAEGYSYSDTIVKFYNPTVLFFDDMEGVFTDNWTSTSNVTDRWAYTTSAAYRGASSMTESPGGLYSTNTTRTVTYRGGPGSFNLSDATAAYLTFWTKHRAENFRDKLQVQVSRNGTTWEAIPGKTTIQEPGTLDGSTINGQPALTGIKEYWVQEVFNLDAYKGTPTLHLRFVFTSNGDGTSFVYQRDDGFYIDDIQLIKSTAILTPLPVTFTGFFGKLLADHTVQLNWTAITDNEHEYFEVERSTDGTNFITIGKVGRNASYQFIDKKPAVGNNFYRLKQIDKSGAFSYSKVINIFLDNTFQLMLYPNPVSDILTLNMFSKQADQYKVEVLDIRGRTVYASETKEGMVTEVKLNVKGWSPQVYILRVTNRRKEVVATQRFIKM